MCCRIGGGGSQRGEDSGLHELTHEAHEVHSPNCGEVKKKSVEVVIPNLDLPKMPATDLLEPNTPPNTQTCCQRGFHPG